MPLERHWERMQTPLRGTTRREGRVVAAVAAALAVATVVVLVIALRTGSSGDDAGCIRLTVASSTGGASLHACGDDAARWCSNARRGGRRDDFARELIARCRGAGYL